MRTDSPFSSGGTGAAGQVSGGHQTGRSCCLPAGLCRGLAPGVKKEGSGDPLCPAPAQPAAPLLPTSSLHSAAWLWLPCPAGLSCPESVCPAGRPATQPLSSQAPQGEGEVGPGPGWPQQGHALCQCGGGPKLMDNPSAILVPAVLGLGIEPWADDTPAQEPLDDTDPPRAVGQGQSGDDMLSWGQQGKPHGPWSWGHSLPGTEGEGGQRTQPSRAGRRLLESRGPGGWHSG